MNDKFVKLSAIEQMAKPMSSFHKGEEKSEDSEDMVKCPECGCEFNPEEEYEEEDED